MLSKIIAVILFITFISLGVLGQSLPKEYWKEIADQSNVVVVGTAEDVYRVIRPEKFKLNADGSAPTESDANAERLNEPTVLSKDYWTALNSAKENAKNENREKLKLCLQSRFFDVKTICVKSIVDLEGENILGRLIEMLRSNQIPQRSTERNLQRKELNFVLIESIEKITGLELLITDNLNVKEINRILRESRRWLASRKGIKFDENQLEEIKASDELLGYNVSSRSNQQLKENDMTVKEKWQSLIRILEDTNLRENSPEKVVAAIQQIGKLKNAGAISALDAVPALVDLLDYKKVVEKKSDVDAIFEPHLIGPGENYPAINTLFLIGKPALPYLAKAIEGNELESIKSKNALITISYIFREDLSKGIEFLEKAKTETTNPEAKFRIQKAIEATRAKYNVIQSLLSN